MVLFRSESTNIYQAYYVPVPRRGIETQEQNKAGKVTALTELTDSQKIPHNTEDRGEKIINSLQTVMRLYLS